MILLLILSSIFYISSSHIVPCSDSIDCGPYLVCARIYGVDQCTISLFSPRMKDIKSEYEGISKVETSSQMEDMGYGIPIIEENGSIIGNGMKTEKKLIEIGPIIIEKAKKEEKKMKKIIDGEVEDKKMNEDNEKKKKENDKEDDDMLMKIGDIVIKEENIKEDMKIVDDTIMKIGKILKDEDKKKKKEEMNNETKVHFSESIDEKSIALKKEETMNKMDEEDLLGTVDKINWTDDGIEIICEYDYQCRVGHSCSGVSRVGQNPQRICSRAKMNRKRQCIVHSDCVAGYRCTKDSSSTFLCTKSIEKEEDYPCRFDYECSYGQKCINIDNNMTFRCRTDRVFRRCHQDVDCPYGQICRYMLFDKMCVTIPNYLTFSLL